MEEDKSQENQKNWPFLVALFLFALNTDFIANHFLVWLGLTDFAFYFWLILIATIEVLCWFIFFRWLLFQRVRKGKKVKRLIELSKEVKGEKKIKEIIEWGKETKEELQRKGFFEQVKDIFSREITKASNSWALKALKYGGITMFYMTLFGIASIPIPLGRTSMIILCGITNSRFGLFLVMCGNIVHIYVWNDVILKNTIWKLFG